MLYVLKPSVQHRSALIILIILCTRRSRRGCNWKLERRSLGWLGLSKISFGKKGTWLLVASWQFADILFLVPVACTEVNYLQLPCIKGWKNKGLVPPLMLEAPKRAVKLSVCSSKTIIHSLTFPPSASNDFWGKTYLGLSGESKMTQNLSILTGCSAGATVTNSILHLLPFLLTSSRKVLSSCPLNLWKSSTMFYLLLHLLPSCFSRLQDKASTYKGPMDVVKQVVRKDGLLGLYAGMESTFWRCD